MLWQRDNPGGGGKADHLHQYLRGREHFLAGSYDALLVIESDIAPPPDTLKRLAALDADLAYGIYQLRGPLGVINAFERYPGSARNPGESLSLRPERLAEAVKARKARITGGGFGCVLMKRRVLERIPFRADPGGGWCDTAFFRDALEAGFEQIADFDVRCGHINRTGETIWPKLP